MMKKLYLNRRYYINIFFLLLIVGVGSAFFKVANNSCDIMKKRMNNPEAVQAQQFADHYFQLILKQNYAELAKYNDPAAIEKIKSFAPQLASEFAKGAPLSIETVGYLYRVDPGKSQKAVVIALQYHYPHNWYVIELEYLVSNEKIHASHFVFDEIEQSLQDKNKITFSTMSTKSIITVIATISVCLLSIFALYLCAITPGIKYKWLWLPFIAVGIGCFTFNWAADSWTFSPLCLTAFSATYINMHGCYGLPYIKFGIPIGAMLFLAKYWRLKRLA